ncbi:MAG: 4Fe-4S binding protein [Clostridia bacterium]|nr:4Fe-4S binding protein [Clostridia bacterium]
MFEQTGIASAEMVLSKFPPIERIARGRVALAECYARIPCNPCEDACPFGAITVGPDINEMPVVDFDRCVGCGKCVSRCPGLAIMLVDGSVGDGCADIYLPYEFRPLPAEGDVVAALDRSGAFVCDARVLRVDNSPANDGTPVIRLRIPRSELYAVRNISLK